jgi:cyanophycinase
MASGWIKLSDMKPLRLSRLILACVSALVAGSNFAAAAEFRYMRAGNAQDAPAAAPKAGFALMGGGDDLDEVFLWLCDRAGGGDFLVLRATNNDEYNAYVQKLCHVNSVATLVIPSRAAASDPEVAKIIGHASALFISGGDQANYINFWMGTPVQAALNDAIRRGVPMGGTSAGLAVMGEWAYSAQGDKPDVPNLDSKSVLVHPGMKRITLVKGFLEIPILKGVITDSHFAKRDRMGRFLVFMAHLSEPDGKAVAPPERSPIRGIGVDEGAAVLLEPDGQAKVAGRGSCYIVDPVENALFSDHQKAFEMGDVMVRKIAQGHSFNVRAWTGDGVSYTLSVHEGRLHSTQTDGAVY